MSLRNRAFSAPNQVATFGKVMAALAVLFVLLAPKAAQAWIEITVVSDDMKVHVERTGGAIVEHSILLRLRGATLRSFALAGIDPDATPETEATISPLPTREGAPPETSMPMTVLVTPDGGLRLELNDGHGVGRGSYLLHLRYRTDLVKAGAFERDGAMLRLRWLGPKWPNGMDTAKCTFVLPPGATEPRAGSDRRDGDIDPQSDLALSGAGAFLTTVRRSSDHDELELMRPHLARGEQVAWIARIDPHVLSAVSDPRLTPLPSATAQATVNESSRERQVWLAIGLGIAILFTALTAIKGRQVEAAARSVGVIALPLLPLSVPLRALLAGPMVAIAVTMEIFVDPPFLGALVLVLAMALMAHRTPAPRPSSRSPGRWLAINDDEAFRAAPRPADAWLDASTRSGKVALVLATLAMGGVVTALLPVSPYHATMAALDSACLAVLFFTGRRAELGASLAFAPVAPLKKIARRLRKADPSLRVVPWARFPTGEMSHDEIRVLVMPKSPLRGLSSVEIGFVYPAGAGGPIGCAEVLVRVAEESNAENAARALAPLGRWVNGRRAGERVLSLEPRLPGWRSAASLALRVAALLADQPMQSPSSQRGTSASSSAGRAARTSKAATSASPLQVTDAACSA